MANPAQSALAKLPMAAKFGVGAGLSAVIFFGYWFVFYSDVASKIEGAKRQRKGLQDDLVTQQAAESSYFADRGDLAIREQRARDLNKVLPPDAEEGAFLSSVQQAANAAGIELNGYAPLDEVTQAFYAKVPMRLDLNGKFHQIAKFAHELGKMDRVINVENIVLTDPAVSGDEIVLRAHCLATAFHAIVPAGSPRDASGSTTQPGGVK
jgi:type IV pilus assembly protein PilO